jgi:hypothetical protein
MPVASVTRMPTFSADNRCTAMAGNLEPKRLINTANRNDRDELLSSAPTRLRCGPLSRIEMLCGQCMRAHFSTDYPGPAHHLQHKLRRFPDPASLKNRLTSPRSPCYRRVRMGDSVSIHHPVTSIGHLHSSSSTQSGQPPGAAHPLQAMAAHDDTFMVTQKRPTVPLEPLAGHSDALRVTRLPAGAPIRRSYLDVFANVPPPVISASEFVPR